MKKPKKNFPNLWALKKISLKLQSKCKNKLIQLICSKCFKFSYLKQQGTTSIIFSYTLKDCFQIIHLTLSFGSSTFLMQKNSVRNRLLELKSMSEHSRIVTSHMKSGSIISQNKKNRKHLFSKSNKQLCRQFNKYCQVDKLMQRFLGRF